MRWFAHYKLFTTLKELCSLSSSGILPPSPWSTWWLKAPPVCGNLVVHLQWQIRWVKMRFVVDMKSFLVACVAETSRYSLGHEFECWVLVLFLSPVSFQVIKLATSTSFTPACDYSLTKSFLSFFTMNMPQLTECAYIPVTCLRCSYTLHACLPVDHTAEIAQTSHSWSLPVQHSSTEEPPL